MTPEMHELYQKFIKIRKMKYIESINNEYYAVGETFEQLLGKQRDDFPIADYKGIEVKVTPAYINGDVSLFCAEPDGKFLFANEELVNKYGYLKKGKTFNFFHLEVSGDQQTRYIKYFFRLKIDYQNKEIVLNVYNYRNELIDSNTSWSFALIKEKLNLKLNILALIKYYPKVINNKKHYWYCYLEFYKNIIFDQFLKEIENGNISVCFAFDEYKSGPKQGKRHNHGTYFKIKAKNIGLIYEKKL